MKKKIGAGKVVLIILLCLVAVTAGYLFMNRGILFSEKPEELIKTYYAHVEKQEYKEMYAMTDADTSGIITEKDYIDRNANIYEGMEIRNLKVDHIETTNRNSKTTIIHYRESFETVAGNVEFENEATFVETKEGYRIVWRDGLILPDLEEDDKVQVITRTAKRGEILDRNGKVLAGKGIATSVGIIPGKMEDKAETIKLLAQGLDMDEEDIEDKLAASWVTDELFVPVKMIPKISEANMMQMNPDEALVEEYNRQEKLLEIPGVMFSDAEVRSYPLGEAAAHLIGYVQTVTAEDLEEHQGEDYSSTSVIGRSGMEGLYEKELKGQDGHQIKIVDRNGLDKEVIASILKKDGEDIQLTIDRNLQKSLYEQFQEEPGCSAAMNPYTGEVLALVSTPSYDNNEFITGMSETQWTTLNEDTKKPLYNRFRQIWSPGSTFKPIIAAIGLETGTLDPNEDFGSVGLSWQKDSSWGSYYVTTLHEYTPVIMKNALIYSDNIYFAKAALKIGGDNLMTSLDTLGFNQEFPFEITMTNSQYSNTEKIETEIQLADSGYGQGQILVNPLHLASIYTAFLNNGNIIKPYLRYEENASAQTWIPQAFSTNTVNQVMEGMIGVVNDPAGTADQAHREDMTLAGKTGTAEIKATTEDTSGTEIGWFSVFTTDPNTEKPLLLVSMVEDVKNLGGSGYVVEQDSQIIDSYFR